MWVYIWDDNYSDYSAMRGPCPKGYHIPTYNEHVSLKNIMQTLGIPYSTDYELYLHMPFRWWMRKYGNGSVDYTTQSSYWTCSESSNAWYAWYLTGSTGGTVTTSNNGYGRRAQWNHIRPFRDTPITLNSPNVVSFTKTYSWTGDAWVYEFTLTSWEIVVSITADWVSWITIANKNLWATTMYISWDTASEANCWKFYQWGNNYWFPFTWSITTSSTRVDASSYWPWNYYSSSTFITNSTNPADWSSVQNDNLRWWVTGIKHMSDLKNAYIGEYRVPGENTVAYYPLNSTDTLSDKSWNSYDLTNSWSVAFWIQQWVDCAWFTSWGSSSWSRWLYRTSDTIITPQSTDLTFHVWLYKWSETMYYNPRIIGRYNSSIFTYASRSKISTADSTTYGITPVEWAWFLFSCVYKYSDKTWDYYLNGAYQNTQTNSTPASYSNAWIVLGTRDGLWTWYWDKWSWWMSNIIIENKVRTAQEISNYYNSTKSNYGL